VYYKVVETIFSIISLLQRCSLYNLDPNDAELKQNEVVDLLETLKELIHQAEVLLPEVCELTKDAAENYANAPAPLQIKGGLTVGSAEPYIQVGSDTASSLRSPVLDMMEEPVHIQVDDTEEQPPIIPTSLLDIERYSIVMQLQLVLQKLVGYSRATAKARSNGAFVAGIRSIIDEMSLALRRKVSLDQAWHRSNTEISLLDIHPAIIAKQLTLLDARIFQTLPIDAALGNGMDPPRDFGQENADLYKFVATVVQFEVLAPRELSDRIRALNHWLSVAQELEKLYSYNMLKSISDAMNSSGVHKAKGLREGLGQNRDFELRKLSERTGVKQNYKLLHEAMESVDLDGKAVLPALSVYLNDLAILSSRRENDVNRAQKAVEAEQIVVRLRIYQKRCVKFIETIEPDAVAQHWILTRPYKNSRELTNLAVSRSASGGMYSPSSSSEKEKTPNILDFGDTGQIMFNGLQERILNCAGNGGFP